MGWGANKPHLLPLFHELLSWCWSIQLSWDLQHDDQKHLFGAIVVKQSSVWECVTLYYFESFITSLVSYLALGVLDSCNPNHPRLGLWYIGNWGWNTCDWIEKNTKESFQICKVCLRPDSIIQKMYWFGQKIHSSISITFYGKTQRNFWPTQY